MPFPENLAPFFSPSVFGTAATYLSGTVYGIFESGFAAAQVGAGAGVEGARYTFTCPAANVPNIARGATLTIAATAYTVKSVQPDGTGVVDLILERA